MEGDHRTRRLTESPPLGQRKLDDSPPLPPTDLVEGNPSEVLEPPPTQHAAARLEDRQKRWFRLREAAYETMENRSASTSESVVIPSADPKG